MARPIKRLHGEPDVVKDLRRRSRSTTIGMRDQERAEIILLRLDGVSVEAVAERLKTTPKRVSLWPGRFETFGLKGLDDNPGRGRFASVNELVVDIETYLAERNANPKPYKWKAEGAEILSKIKRPRRPRQSRAA